MVSVKHISTVLELINLQINLGFYFEFLIVPSL